ncbi:hypothetical protein [Burkholderia sp. Bp9140]|uniref:hypothetical protein n=1 Tax=Burkholderia sp. Bp9140 TaxID=2184572 RepID=UPI000F57B507|nr:hypothetical protein [Burkholderia sp. Bp9140]
MRVSLVSGAMRAGRRPHSRTPRRSPPTLRKAARVALGGRLRAVSRGWSAGIAWRIPDGGFIDTAAAAAVIVSGLHTGARAVFPPIAARFITVFAAQLTRGVSIATAIGTSFRARISLFYRFDCVALRYRRQGKCPTSARANAKESLTPAICLRAMAHFASA